MNEAIIDMTPDISDRNLWPVVLFSIPFAAVLFGILMVSTALFFPDDVVVDQYYKEGMAINERIADTEKAVELGVGATIYLDGDRISAEIFNSVNSVHVLNFHHVTDENRDVTLNLIKQGDRFVALEVSEIQQEMSEPGVWYVDLVGVEQEWRISKRLKTPLAAISLGAMDD